MSVKISERVMGFQSSLSGYAPFESSAAWRLVEGMKKRGAPQLFRCNENGICKCPCLLGVLKKSG